MKLDYIERAFAIAFLAVCSLMAYEALSTEPNCTTDTDCAVRYGGNGDPEPESARDWKEILL